MAGTFRVSPRLGREYRLQQVPPIRIAFEVRVAQAAVVVEPHRAEALSFAHDEADRRTGMLCRPDDRLEPIDIERHLVDGDDPAAGRQAGPESGSIPQHLFDFAILV